jgi:hypothetical protein
MKEPADLDIPIVVRLEKVAREKERMGTDLLEVVVVIAIHESHMGQGAPLSWLIVMGSTVRTVCRQCRTRLGWKKV